MSVGIAELTALGAAPATNDLLVLVDVSDTTQSPAGSTKNMTVANLFTSPTFTGTTATAALNVTGAFTATVSVDSQLLVMSTLRMKTSGGWAFQNAASTALGSWDHTSGLLSLLFGLSVTGNIAGAAGITSSGPTGTGIGYATGAGGAVTQITSRATGVTLNKLAGAITTDTSALPSGSSATFVVTNSTVLATDRPTVVIRSGRVSSATMVSVVAVASGSFSIMVANLSGATSETGALVIAFNVVRGADA